MAKLNNEQKEQRRQIALDYNKKKEMRYKEQFDKLPEGVRKFLRGYYRSDEGINSKLGQKLKKGLKNGDYKKPSEFVEKELGCIFGSVLPIGMKESLLYAVDNCIDSAYSYGYSRRPFRSRDYYFYAEKVHAIIYQYVVSGGLRLPFEQIVSGDITDEQRAYFQEFTGTLNEYDAAYSIDKKLPVTMEYIRELLQGGTAEGLGYDIFKAVFISRDRELYELTGKLLLAARLQEGLRQAICETCDCGRLEAFEYMIKVITDNDLVRFSSVKRAVGTWTGLIAYESGDLERINGKTLELINGCLDDEAYRTQCLESDDAMRVHMGLWSIAVSDVKRCRERVEEFCQGGTHPQVMAAAYFIRELWDNQLRSDIAKGLLLTRSGELDVMALIMPYLFNTSTAKTEFDPKAELKKQFKDKTEAAAAYDRLLEIYNSIPKKALEFSPCVFPWNSERLTKSAVVKLLIFIAVAMEDNDRIDFMCKKLGEIDVSNYGTRRHEIKLMLTHPKTDTQLDTLVAEVADREEYARKAAFELVKKQTLAPRHYLMLEDMLRYKTADIRAGVIELMLAMEDGALYESIKRLVCDKKEEKRTAGLDMIMQLGKAENRAELYEKCLSLTALIEKPTTKEQILIDQLAVGGENGGDNEEGFGFYTSDDSWQPVPDEAFAIKCREEFLRYFPGSKYNKNKKLSLKLKKPRADFVMPLQALDKLIEQHKNDEYTNYAGEKCLLGSQFYLREKAPDGTQRIPFISLWEDFYKEQVNDPVLLFRMIAGMPGAVRFGETLKLFGSEFETKLTLTYQSQMWEVLRYLENKLDEKSLRAAAYAAKEYLYELASEGCELYKESERSDNPYWTPMSYYVKDGLVYETQKNVHSIFSDTPVSRLEKYYAYRADDDFRHYFTLDCALEAKLGGRLLQSYIKGKNVNSAYVNSFSGPGCAAYLRAAYQGIITEGVMYKHFFEDCLGSAMSTLSGIAQTYRDSQRKRMTRQRWSGYRTTQAMRSLLCDQNAEITDENRPLIEYAVDIYEKLTALVLDRELKRGDTPSQFTESAKEIGRIYGADRFVQILASLGKETLERTTYYYSNSKDSKKSSLSRLLGVCVPREDDTSEKLGELVRPTDITDKRLVEAALFSPEWIDIVGGYLGWEGFRSACYYFMAHMNEHFDDVRKAMIAKFTPISTEDLMSGAFDIDWFREALAAVGEQRFEVIYGAAKYISDGAKHSRARKYADAATGKLSREEALKNINEKRSKDTLMAYALIPIEGEGDIFERYLRIQSFKKESRQFGAQRRAGETKAAETAMQNLAKNAGYEDVTRLTLRMETKMFDEIRDLTEPNVIDELTLRLVIDEEGKAAIECLKNGKALKAVPAKYKKNDLVIRLNEVKKQLTEQYRRTRQMLEQSMEDRVAFKAGELEALSTNPVVYPLIKTLVFTDIKGSKAGFFNGGELTDHEGRAAKLKADSELIIAHPFDLYRAGVWREYQSLLFENRVKQPFKQVFRELYVKTEDEAEAVSSLRYSGNQINPRQTQGCLRGRRWVADVEDGLQKIYYKENIIARIYALADWFSPADIEAPTLEWVDFTDRKTGKPIRIADIPDVIFSEIMRDVDMAVSVAHAGGVDPETSHSTIEMRRAVCEFTMPLFKLENVTFEGSHAFIKGSLADYSVHLGSGTVHIQGGAMINLLPVHSQHRGRLFLPFADDDPKTAQVISEILLFAEDRKIKDPFILEQIK